MGERNVTVDVAAVVATCRSRQTNKPAIFPLTTRCKGHRSVRVLLRELHTVARLADQTVRAYTTEAAANITIINLF